MFGLKLLFDGCLVGKTLPLAKIIIGIQSIPEIVNEQLFVSLLPNLSAEMETRIFIIVISITLLHSGTFLISFIFICLECQLYFIKITYLVF